jgi:5'-phosphate synthase pdxT subunit
MARPARVGVLALQGDFREHIAVFRSLGAEAVEVRTPEELDGVDAFTIPGGESTTIGRLATIYGLIEPLRSRIEAGMPVLGTCAGMIFLAASTTGKEQPQLGVLDAVVERNAFGRQIDSFEAHLDVEGWDEPIHAVFIRAPWIEKLGAEVDVLASVTDPEHDREHPVFVRQGRILATSFHPELTGDTRIHELLLAMIEER